MPWRTEVEHRGVTLSLRAIPLRNESKRWGALVLCRDVTELRRREKELVTKDATIREIHHRVKNNLQTVAALLRMQSRRMSSADGKQGLEQAMRRVSTIGSVRSQLLLASMGSLGSSALPNGFHVLGSHMRPTARRFARQENRQSPACQLVQDGRAVPPKQKRRPCRRARWHALSFQLTFFPSYY